MRLEDCMYIHLKTTPNCLPKFPETCKQKAWFTTRLFGKMRGEIFTAVWQQTNAVVGSEMIHSQNDPFPSRSAFLSTHLGYFFFIGAVRFLRASILLVCRMAVTRLPGHARNRSFGRSKNVFCIHRAGGIRLLTPHQGWVQQPARQIALARTPIYSSHRDAHTHFFKCRLRNELLTQWDLPQIKAPLMRQKKCAPPSRTFVDGRKNSWNYTCGCFLIRHESGENRCFASWTCKLLCSFNN